MGLISLIERSDKSGLECIEEKEKRKRGALTMRGLKASGAAGKSEGERPALCHRRAESLKGIRRGIMHL